MSDKRNVIVHFHIFKNAGCTVDLILKRNFPQGFVSLDPAAPGAFFSAADGLEYIRKNVELTVLASHQLEYPLPGQKNLAVHSLFFLRHPIDRIGSIYRYSRDINQSAALPTVMAKRLDLKDYLAWVMEKGKGRIGGIHDFQVRKLSCADGDRRDKITKKKLAIAKQRLRRSPFFGIVERFDDSLLLMKRYLRKHFPGMDFSYTVQNRSSGIADPEKRIAELRASVGEDLYRRLLEINRYDLELYKYALRLFDRRCSRARLFSAAPKNP